MLNANIYPATKTVQAFDDMVAADQGNLYRHYLKQVMPHISDAYRQDEDPFRSHMGASQIGSKCAREIWFSFRWAFWKPWEGRMLRLVNRGHLEEARFIALLLGIGAQVYQQDTNGNQYRISHAGGHFGGSGDGIAIGIPDLHPGTPCLTEFKTLSTKYAPALETNGLRAEKFEHYVQMNVYMRKMDLAVGLYLSVDKNTDKIYGEIIPVNVQLADEYLARAEKLIYMTELPERISNNASWFECKFCDFHSVCHKKGIPARNCRTCMFAKPMPDGTWSCSNVQSEACGTIDKKRQLIACDKYYRAF